jgi:anti-sigma B factor antagonist
MNQRKNLSYARPVAWGELCTIDVTKLGDQGVIRVCGELDLSNRASMERAVEALVAGTQREIVLDVSQLRFVDAHGLRSWRTTAEVLHARGRQLVVRDPAPLIRRLLGVTGVDAFVRVEATRSS